MSKTFRNFPNQGRALTQPKAPRPQPRDKSCGAKLKETAQNYRREMEYA